MADVKVTEDLWASSMLPEGLIERWLVADGATVATGEAVVEVRIEDALHEILAPAAGRLKISARVNDVIDPGSALGQIAP